MECYEEKESKKHEMGEMKKVTKSNAMRLKAMKKKKA